MSETRREEEKIIGETNSLLKDRLTLRGFVNSTFELPGITPHDREKMEDFLVDVLEGGKEDLWPILGSIESIIMVAENYYRQEIYCSLGEKRDELQVILPDLSKFSEKYIKYSMACQLAHLLLCHYKIKNRVWNKIKKQSDEAVDVLVASWGFPPPEKKGGNKK